MSLNFLNRSPCSGYVKKYAIIFSVGQYSTLIPSYCNLSFIQKYILSVCLVFCPLDAFPFSSILIALWLSCKRIFSSIVNPWASKNIFSQITFGRQSLTPTISVSVEIFLFNVFFGTCSKVRPIPKTLSLQCDSFSQSLLRKIHRPTTSFCWCRPLLTLEQYQLFLSSTAVHI